jgi:hypothetical protein
MLYPHFVADFNSRQRTKNLGQHSQLSVQMANERLFLMSSSSGVIYHNATTDLIVLPAYLSSMTVLCTAGLVGF